MKKVFISRELEKGSAFKKTLPRTSYQIHGESLIEFEAVPFTKTPKADWTFFYSKQCVRFYFENIDSTAYLTSKVMRSPRMPHQRTNPRYAVFGTATAQYLKQTQNIVADFVGSGEATTTAEAFFKKAKARKTLFVCGQNSMRSVQELLPDSMDWEELIVYGNTPKKKFKIPACDYLVFTSPMNVKAYYKKYKPRKKHMVIAIGATTAEALLNAGVEKLIIAREPSEQKLAEIVLT